MARRADGETREPAVATVDRTWRAVLLFGAADGGPWTVEVSVDGVSCVSQLTVTLPAGVVAPPAPTLAPAPPSVEPPGGIDAASFVSTAALSAVILVIASWLFLALLALVRLAGRRLLRRRAVRVAARMAIFVAVLGAGVAAWAIVDLAVGFSHFDSGVPRDQQAMLGVALWIVVVLGALLGTLAARQVRNPAPAAESRW